MRNLIPTFIHRAYQKGEFNGKMRAVTIFVDLAGFTSLTEALTQDDMHGAETLSETMDAVFSPLVQIIYAQGGIIPLFAGDAFSAIFPIQDHVTEQSATERALQAAAYIQHRFRAIGDANQVDTPQGTFELNVKIGLAVGQIEWGIPAYADLRQFYFRGQAIDLATAAQAVGKPGQVIVDASFTPYLDANTFGIEPLQAPHFLLSKLEWHFQPNHRQAPSFDHHDLESFIPARILSLEVDAEFRQICTLFISFEEIEEQSALDHFLQDMMRFAEKFGAYFNQIDFSDKGGMLLFLFGAPLTREDDLQRAAAFLISLRQQQLPVRWRAGLTFGRVWAGIRGGIERCEYGAAGDPVNLAARLATLAEWGDIWIDATAKDRLVATYATEALGDFHIKGKRIAVSVFKLRYKKQLGPQNSLFETAMLGRENELRQLKQYVSPIFQGAYAGIVYVYGQAGVGKSRLIQECCQRTVDTSQTRIIYCPVEELQTQSFYPFRHFLMGYFKQLPINPPDTNWAAFDSRIDGLCQRLNNLDQDTAFLRQELTRTRSFLAAMVDLYEPNSLYAQLDPELRFDNTLTAFAALLKAESLLQPSVLYLSNAQWLDDDSRKMLDYLLAQMDGYPFAFLATIRSDSGAEPWQLFSHRNLEVNSIHLRGLSRERTSLMAISILGQPIDRQLADYLFEKTNGNPYFLEQLLLELRHQSMLITNGADSFGCITLSPVATDTIPNQLDSLLVARLDRLAPAVKQVVQAASVFGQQFEAPILLRMIGNRRETAHWIEQAAKEKIWHKLSTGRYAFSQTLLRDAAYNMQMPTRLRALHRSAAYAIEQHEHVINDAHIADLAFHYDKAGDHERAVEWYIEVGRRASDHFANKAAVHALTRARELLPEENYLQHFGITLMREMLFSRLGERRQQNDELKGMKQVLEALPAGDTQIRSEVTYLLRQSLYAQSLGDYPASIAAAERAAELTDNGNMLELHAEAHLRVAQTLWRTGDYDSTCVQLEEAFALAQGTGLEIIEAESLYELGKLASIRGYFEDGLWHGRRALQLAQKLTYRMGEADALHLLGEVAGYRGQFNDAIHTLKSALTIFQEMGHKRGLAASHDSLGNQYAQKGEYDNALNHYHKARKIWRESGDWQGVGTAYYNQARIYHALGNYIGATTSYHSAAAVFNNVGDRRGEIRVQVQQALLALDSGNSMQAQLNCERSLELIAKLNDPIAKGQALQYLGASLIEQGKLDAAAAALQQSVNLRQQLRQQHLAVEGIAALLQIAGIQEDQLQAESLLELLLPQIKRKQLAGSERPISIYIICYQLLDKLGDPRAEELLEQGYQLLQTRAATISDAVLRHSYLENVRAHQTITQLWHNRQDSMLDIDDIAPPSISPLSTAASPLTELSGSTNVPQRAKPRQPRLGKQLLSHHEQLLPLNNRGD